MISCLLLFSCKGTQSPGIATMPEPSFKTGLYKSKIPSRLEWINLRLQGIKSYSKGTELKLNPDSTYDMLTCGAIGRGRWYIDSSKLYLKAEYINWRLDSFRKHGFEGRWPELNKEPIVFMIKNDMIYMKYRNRIDMLEYSKDKPTAYDK